jgi:hypothetical protein
MHQLNRVLSILLVTATATVSLPHLLPSRTIAQTNPQPQASWWQIFQNDPPVDEKPGSPRDLSAARFCAITPRSINTDTQVWSDRPLFVWQGNYQKIGLRLEGNQEVFWTQTVASGDKSVIYTGDALQPGQTYNWVIFSQQNNPIMFIPFKVMDAPERDRIRVRLTILERELKDIGATPEEIAMQRANFFARQELWSDVFKEIYSLKNPSPELEEILQQIPSTLCSRRQSENRGQGS